VNLALAGVLAPRFAQYGMAWAVVSAETIVCICLVIVVRRIAPFWIRPPEPLLTGALSEPVSGRLD
jgi:hypothetical protein